MRRQLKLILCFGVIFGLLAGCGSSQGDAHTPTGDGLYWDDDYTGQVQQPTQDEIQALSLTYYPDQSLNPYQCTDFTNRALFSLLYQGLFSYNREYAVEPILCDKYRVSEDMKSYTFYIRNATFSDGSALTADDVAASLQAAKDSPIYKGRFQHVTEIVRTADGGVQLTLDTAYENLPLLLDVPIVRKDQTAQPQPLGTGPYYVEQLTDGIRLRRRNDWWCKATLAVTAPSIAMIKAESSSQIRDNFEFSDLGMVCADPGSDRYADFRCDYELWDCENGIFLYLACNMDSEVFSIPEVRKALTHAVDRDTLTDSYYRGFARSATLPASPLFPHYSATLAEKYGYDSAKFTQAVTDAQVRQMQVVLLVNSGDSLRLRVARQIGNMLSDCGLVVQIKELSGSSYTNALRNREYDLYLGQTMLSANMDLSAFFSTNGALSYGGINDVGMYALCLESLVNHGNYFTLHQRVMEDGRLVPILFRSYAVFATRGLLSDLTPARDSVFYYSLGRTMDSARITQ